MYLIGCSAPDFELEHGTRLAEFLHDDKGLLLDFSESEQLCTFAQRWKERLKYVSTGAKDSKGLTAILVRPDGFVAWATESEPDASAAETSIEHWFGDAS